MIISLTGFMGVGKSTISERLSKHLYCKVVDLDRHIEQHEGMTIDEIFKTKGEQFFREIEELYLDKILLENREKVLVLSLGGGTLISEKNQKIIKEKTFCIYLKGNANTHISRLCASRKTRPHIEKLTEEEYAKGIEELFEIRREGYEKSSSLVIEVDNKSIKAMISEIISAI